MEFTYLKSVGLVVRTLSRIGYGQWMDVNGRIADNTFGKVLPRLEVSDLMACLHRLVKAEHFLLQLCDSNLDSKATGDVEAAPASVFSRILKYPDSLDRGSPAPAASAARPRRPSGARGPRAAPPGTGR